MEITGTPGLPVGFTYWYEAENDKEYIIKIKEIMEPKAALEWVRQLSRCSFALWSADKPYRRGYETLFRKHFRCQHSGGTRLHQPAKCRAAMNIRIMRTTTTDDWPCIAQFRGEHNHEVGAPFSLSYHPITEEMQNEILNLYENGYHPYTAYTTYCKEKLSQLGLESWAFFADRYIFPTKEDFKILWKKHVRDLYIAKSSNKKENSRRATRVSGEGNLLNRSDESVSGGIEVSEIEEDYFGQRMIDETNDRLDSVSNGDKLIPNSTAKEVGSVEDKHKVHVMPFLSTDDCDKDLVNNNITVQETDNKSMNCGKDSSHTQAKENIKQIYEPISITDLSNAKSLHNVLEKMKPLLITMTRENLQKLCVQKIVEEISAKTAIEDLQKLLKKQDGDLRQCQAQNSTLIKRNQILKMVLTSVCGKKCKFKKTARNDRMGKTFQMLKSERILSKDQCLSKAALNQEGMDEFNGVLNSPGNVNVTLNDVYFEESEIILNNDV